MDLITHIPGVGPTSAFNPGATTPAPYNVPHTGALDGVGPGTASKNVAEIYNRDLLWRRALIAAAGLAFDPTNWVQEVAAIQSMISTAAGAICVAGGTADALTGDFTPDVAVLTNGLRVYVRAGLANATTTPTFKADGTAIKTIAKGNNLPLAPGDIAGAGHWLELQYDLAFDKYLLLNPARGVSGIQAGTVFAWPGTTAPAGALALPLVASNVSRTTYAAIFAAIGTTWGVGDGVTTFGLPYLAADHAFVQANANVGTLTTGVVKSHTHTVTQYNALANRAAGGDGNYWDGVAGVQTAATGGTDNLAAGRRMLWCIQL